MAELRYNIYSQLGGVVSMDDIRPAVIERQDELATYNFRQVQLIPGFQSIYPRLPLEAEGLQVTMVGVTTESAKFLLCPCLDPEGRESVLVMAPNGRY